MFDTLQLVLLLTSLPQAGINHLRSGSNSHQTSDHLELPGPLKT
jgi:hypothetical protein